jgi:hypothetical protein
MNLDLRKIPAIYINVAKDTDKNQSMLSLFEECGFENVIRVEGQVFPDRHLAGCSLSHYNALNEIDPPFIVFEDDCKIKQFEPTIKIPDDADALYLGVSSWGRMNSHSGPCVQYASSDEYPNILKIYNMLGAHAILYLTKEYVSICSKIANHYYETSDHQDIGFAEIQRYYEVYSVDEPMFYQTSSNGTYDKLSSYPTMEIVQPHKAFWKPTTLY